MPGKPRLEEGAVESSTYVNAAEQVDSLPAASVAVARKLVDESAGTLTEKPAAGERRLRAAATGAPEQSLVVKSSTVEPASAEPLSSGSLSFAGEAGFELEIVGAAGGLESAV